MNTRNRRKRVIVYSIIIFLAALGISATAIRSVLLVRDNYETQLIRNLGDVSRQYAEAVQGQIETRYGFLRSVNTSFENSVDDKSAVIDSYRTEVDTFRLKRLGYVDTDGIAYATDASGIDLSYRLFFQKGMAGEEYISDVIQDAMNDEHTNVIVMSKPMRNKTGDIIGVTCVTYEVDILSDELAGKSFSGAGDSFVITPNGIVAVTSNKEMLPVGSTLFDESYVFDDGEKNIREKIKQRMRLHEEMDGSIYLNGEKYFFQMTPVELMDGVATWSVMSVVPDTYFQDRFSEIKSNLQRMVILIAAFFIGAAACTRYFFREQRRITYSLAYESPLTGGPNLERFFEHMRGIKTKSGYIVYMNLEDFKHTSVAMGIERSNELIKKIWEIIFEEEKYGEYAGHVSADNFVMHLKADDDEALKERLKSLRDMIHEVGHSFDIPWVYAKYGACKLDDTDYTAAYSRAEYTVFDTWGQKECVSFYSDEDHEKQALNKSIEENFADAISNRRLEVWYQPKYDVTGKIITGAEALVRWRKIDGSLLSPGLFIPLLEKNGDIAVLDEYVFERVCEQQKQWKEDGHKIVPISINLSRASLYVDGIVEKYLDIIKKNGLETKDVQIEVTETIVGGSDKIQDLLTEFRSIGIKILMDDFGTGYSSLSTLNMKCFDTLKIDKSLVDEIRDDYGQIIINQTIELGNALGLYITVEGVEENEQLDILSKMKCNDIQGYLFSKPLPVSEFEKILA